MEWTTPPFELIKSQWYGPRGAFVTTDPPAGTSTPKGTYWLLCCPRCGAAGSPKDAALWQVIAGSWDDVTTLTLKPSILKSCCGWHGYLVKGVFQLEQE